MTRPSFNLVTQPWIPVRWRGQTTEFGLEEALLKAAEIEEISDDSPVVTAGLQRLLLAILHRALGGPDSRVTWAQWWRQGAFAAAPIQAYLDKWRHRLDLLDPERPFYQTIGLPYTEDKRKKASSLFFEFSSYGFTSSLFRPPTLPRALSFAQAARALVAFHAFTPGGLLTRGPGERPSAGAGPLNACAMTSLAGRNLFETSMLNLLIYADDKPIPRTGEDLPAWEQDQLPRAVPRAPAGWVDLLTWQSRRVQFFCEGDQVSEVLVAGGWDVRGEVQEPQAGHRKTQNGWRAVRFEPERAAWRDLTALLEHDETQGLRPKALQQFAALQEEGLIAFEADFPLSMQGINSDQARILFFRHERMPLPRSLLAAPDALVVVRDALKSAEAGALALHKGLRDFGATCLAQQALAGPGGETGRKPRAEDISALLASVDAATPYWSSLQSPFFQLLWRWQDLDSAELWRGEVRRAAERAFRGAVDAYQGTGAALKGAAVGEATLGRELRKMTQPEGAET